MLSTRPASLSASAERLEAMIASRLAPGADQAEIDARIWDMFGETRAVMFTDLTGFSRRVAEFGIIHFLQIIHESMRLLNPVIESHDGILLKVEGDSLMVLFRNAERAVACAQAMQRVARDYDAAVPPTDRLGLCIGLGFGRMLLIGDQDVYGAEVNAASKLGEDAAKAGQTLATQAVVDACSGRAGLVWRPTGIVPPGASAAFLLVEAEDGATG